MNISNDSRIKEDMDSQSGDEFSESDDDDIPMKFKQNILKNKKMFEKQLLESTEINPDEIFDVKPVQEVEGEVQDLHNKMDLQILEYFANDEDEEHKLMKLSAQMTPVQGIDGLFKKLGQPGEGVCPPDDSVVTIHYNGYVQDEITNQIKSFDSTFLRGKSKSFMRGQGQVIEGLDLAVGTMKLNEQSEFIFSADLAFGERGCPPRIPPNAYVYFKIDLIEWIDSSAAEAFGKLPIAVRKKVEFHKVIEAANSEKMKGRAYFEKQNFNASKRCYRKALNWIEDHGYANEEEETRGVHLCLRLHLNLALTYLKINQPKKTCIHCKEALAIEPDNPKALYRFGLAKEKLGDFPAARQMLTKAKQICPLDQSISRALVNLNEKMKKEKYIETELCRKMLGSTSITETTINGEPSSESQKLIRTMLVEFVGNADENHLDFPQGLAQEEKEFLEKEAKRLQLKFCQKPGAKGLGICSVFKS